MRLLKKIFFTSLISIYSLLLPFKTTLAHEAYVLDHNYFWEHNNDPQITNLLTALSTPNNLKVVIFVTLAVFLIYGFNFYLRTTKFAQRLKLKQQRFAHIGPVIIRISVAIALFFSAVNNVFLGPELDLASSPYGPIIRVVLLIISILIFAGLFTEIAGALALLIFLYFIFLKGGYLLNYSNYFGEFLVLLLFGMRLISLDKIIFGPLKHFAKFERYETFIVRIFYGFSLVFAGISMKLLHPDISLKVVNDWNLTQFQWLFPSDPVLVVLGAGLAEITIGLFIILGFEIWLTVGISLFYLTLSLIFFKEQVWPHIILYGISINLLLQPQTLTLDHIFFEEHRKKSRWWHRILHPHNREGKSQTKA